MKRRYRKERDLKSKYNNSRRFEVLQVLDSLSPKELWEACKPSPISIQELSSEEQSRAIQDSRIVVFELLTRRFGYGLLELREDTIFPLGLKLDYLNPLPSDPIQESY